MKIVSIENGRVCTTPDQDERERDEPLCFGGRGGWDNRPDPEFLYFDNMPVSANVGDCLLVQNSHPTIRVKAIVPCGGEVPAAQPIEAADAPNPVLVAGILLLMLSVAAITTSLLVPSVVSEPNRRTRAKRILRALALWALLLGVPVLIVGALVEAT